MVESWAIGVHHKILSTLLYVEHFHNKMLRELIRDFITLSVVCIVLIQFNSFIFNFFKDFMYLTAKAGGAAGRGRGTSRLPTEQGA